MLFEKNHLNVHSYAKINLALQIVGTREDGYHELKMVKKYLDTLCAQWEELPPHFVTSSTTKQGRDDILNYIQDVIASLQSDTTNQ